MRSFLYRVLSSHSHSGTKYGANLVPIDETDKTADRATHNHAISRAHIFCSA